MDFEIERSEQSLRLRFQVDCLSGERSMTRRPTRYAAVIAGFALISTAPAGAMAGALVEGTWVTPDQAEMTIAPCEEGLLCGTLSKIVITEQHVQQYGAAASNIKVEELTDVFNEDPALKSRPMLGLQILTLRATDNPWHFEGEIYNPQDGKTYTGSMEVQGADTVVLKGCAFYVLCQEQTWTRADEAD
jgi:uncharacterized protein (DUF2147 family)